VAMLTASSILWPELDPATKPRAPLSPDVTLPGGRFRAFCAVVMKDRGFWVVSRLGGLTERETLAGVGR
jgi:H+/gluconate symporter-like permease